MHKSIHVISSIGAFVLSLAFALLNDAFAANVSAPRIQYEALQIDVTGPNANEVDVNPNPFLDLRYDLMLESPSGKQFIVPGYFAGDGRGGAQGRVWRAKFTPDEAGRWTYTAKLFSGTNASVLAQTNTLLDITSTQDQTGEFNVSDVQNSSLSESENINKGPLRYVGEHYLRFDDGSYWIKGGVDSPENFLGYAGFDNTINQPGGVGEAQLANGLHHYAEHISDWNEGDPLFVSQHSGVDSKGIIGAINYLASQGVNSMYFLLMNLGGDGRDTYPFTGATGSDYDNTHYDLSKLHQWDIVFEHMQSNGIAVHFVLGEQEEENKTWLDAGELGTQRTLYYREMAARFAHLHAVKWNLSEESRYGDEKHKAFAKTLRSFDWAEHPIAVHSFVDGPEKAYTALLGDPLFSATSIQFSAENADDFTETWRAQSSAAGRPWVIDMDEVGPGNIGLTASNSDQLRREVLYPVYFSGGNIEWYFGFQGADIRTENFRTREPMYRFMQYAREFMHAHLPFWEMHAADDLLTNANENDQVFAKEGDVYAVYLNQGNTAATLATEQASYTVQWFDPVTGELNETIRTVEGSAIELGVSPSKPQQDWVVLIKRRVESNAENTPETMLETSEQNPDTSLNESTGTTENSEASTATDSDDNDIPDIAAAQGNNNSGGGVPSIHFLILCLAISFMKLWRQRTQPINYTKV